MFGRKTILTKTVQVGFLTLISRFLGIIREVLTVSYLGVNELSDVFVTAFKIPNSLRKIFAEGALSAAFIPTLVNSIKKSGKDAISGLMVLGFLFFEGFVLLTCFIVMIYAQKVLSIIAPGFSEQQITIAIPLVRVLMPFIFFISTSALLAGALQAVGHFFVPAFSQIIINIIFIIGLIICIAAHLPLIYLCLFIVLSGLVQCIFHVYAYRTLRFAISLPKAADIKQFMTIFVKFFLCLPSTSIMEVALFVDTSFASYLPAGSISLLYYANRFVGIPLGVFAIAFSTILLPHFSRINSYSPKRLHFYLLESAKFIFWVTAPITLLMIFFSYDIFATIFLSKKFVLSQVIQASHILIVFTIGLFFFSFNKVITNIFYAMHSTGIPALVALSATIFNIMFNIFFINRLQVIGLACATTLSTIMQTVLFVIILYTQYNFRIYFFPFFNFAARYCMQLLMSGIWFLSSYYCIKYLIQAYLSEACASFLLYNVGFWLWVVPLSGIMLFSLWYFRKLCNVHVYFLGRI